MKNFNRTMHLRRDGAVTIPKAMRTALGLTYGMNVNVALQSNGDLKLHPAAVRCPLCDAKAHLVGTSFGVPICPKCLDKIAAYIRKGDSFNMACARIENKTVHAVVK
ncbi:MAG: hypothetical protein RSC43_01045 [Clostridia bacterium]